MSAVFECVLKERRVDRCFMQLTRIMDDFTSLSHRADMQYMSSHAHSKLTTGSYLLLRPPSRVPVGRTAFLHKLSRLGWFAYPQLPPLCN